jgi:hypothetical protein
VLLFPPCRGVSPWHYYKNGLLLVFLEFFLSLKKLQHSGVLAARQYLAIPATSASPERFFSRVGLVQTDLWGRLLDTTKIDLMWAKQAP